MIIVQPRNIRDALITATGTATLLYALVDTAGGGTPHMRAESYYNNIPPASGPGQGQAVNCVVLRPATVDIRVEIGIASQTTRGTLIPAGTTYPIVCDPSQLYLISTAGNTSVDVTYCVLGAGEIPPAPTTGVSVTVTPGATPSLAAATSTPTNISVDQNAVVQLQAATATEQTAVIQNQATGVTNNLYIGRINVDNAGANIGLIVEPGATVSYPTQEGIWGIMDNAIANIHVVSFNN